MRRLLSYGLLISLIFFGLFFAGCMNNERDLTPDNSAPLINYFDLYPQTVVRSNTVSIEVNYTDPDNDNVTFTIVPDSGNPAIGNLKNIDSTHFKWGAPLIGGRYWFKATGNDGNFQTESIFSIIVLSRSPEIELINSGPFSGDSWKYFIGAEGGDFSVDFDFSVLDLDAPPTSTIIASVSWSDSAADAYGDGEIYFVDNLNTTAITVNPTDTSEATITLPDTYSVQIRAQYLIPYSIWHDSWPNTYNGYFNLLFQFTDESGNSNTFSHLIRLYK
ncbi:hypothetical protein J7L48_09920 [bacterium]|nr:hypothetical protein [bacterium]